MENKIEFIIHNKGKITVMRYGIRDNRQLKFLERRFSEELSKLLNDNRMLETDNDKEKPL